MDSGVMILVGSGAMGVSSLSQAPVRVIASAMMTAIMPAEARVICGRVSLRSEFIAVESPCSCVVLLRR